MTTFLARLAASSLASTRPGEGAPRLLQPVLPARFEQGRALLRPEGDVASAEAPDLRPPSGVPAVVPQAGAEEPLARSPHGSPAIAAAPRFSPAPLESRVAARSRESAREPRFDDLPPVQAPASRGELVTASAATPPRLDAPLPRTTAARASDRAGPASDGAPTVRDAGGTLETSPSPAADRVVLVRTPVNPAPRSGESRSAAAALEHELVVEAPATAPSQPPPAVVERVSVPVASRPPAEQAARGVSGTRLLERRNMAASDAPAPAALPSPAAERRTVATPSPRVQLKIGRIEVRQAPAPTPPPAPAPRQAPAGFVSLSDYLKRWGQP